MLFPLFVLSLLVCQKFLTHPSITKVLNGAHYESVSKIYTCVFGLDAFLLEGIP